MGSHRPTLAVAAALVCLALTTACGAGPASAPAAPTTPAAPDLESCRDAICEVPVTPGTTIPVDARYGVANLRVTGVTGGIVTFTVDTPVNGTVTTTCTSQPGADRCTGTDIVAVDPGRSFTVRAEPRLRTTFPAVVLDVVSVGDGRAVLRLGRPETTGTDPGACRGLGGCTVRVTPPATIPLDPGFGAGERLTVDTVGPDTVDYTMAPSDEPEIVCTDDAAACPAFSDTELKGRLLLGGVIGFPRVDITLDAVDAGSAVVTVAPRQ